MLSMCKTRGILGICHQKGLSRRQIAESLQVAHITVGDVIRTASSSSFRRACSPLWVSQSRDILKIIGDRSQLFSTIIADQLPVEGPSARESVASLQSETADNLQPEMRVSPAEDVVTHQSMPPLDADRCRMLQ